MKLLRIDGDIAFFDKGIQHLEAIGSAEERAYSLALALQRANGSLSNEAIEQAESVARDWLAGKS